MTGCSKALNVYQIKVYGAVEEEGDTVGEGNQHFFFTFGQFEMNKIQT